MWIQNRILYNELEDYYTDHCKENCKGISGKEGKPIHIVSRLIDDDKLAVKFINADKYLFLFH